MYIGMKLNMLRKVKQMDSIQVEKVSKIYKNYKKDAGMKASVKGLIHRNNFEKKAVDNISFSIQEGEMVGLLGANGSGKTTIMKMLTGILTPTQGKIEILGFEPHKRSNMFRSQISLIMGQKSQLWWDLPAIDSFHLNKIIYGLGNIEFEKNLEELVTMFEVKEFLNVPVRTLSLGERMKMEFIGALLHKPPILFCDEPTIGLDVIAQQKIHEFLRYYNQMGNTVLFTSHYMSDIEALCRRVIILKEGTIIYDDNLQKIRKKLSKYQLFTIKFNKHIETHTFLQWGEIIEQNNQNLKIRVSKDNTSIFREFLFDNYSIADITIEEAPIEDIVIQALKGGNIN